MTQLFIIFPNELSFYEKMGIEIFEMNKNYEDFFVKKTRMAGIDFCNTLFYQNKPYEWDIVSKRICVLMTSVALYQNWFELFKYTPDKLIGYGIGYLSALVCEGVISPQSAIQVIRSGNPRKAKIVKLPNKAEYLTEIGKVRTKEELFDKMFKCLSVSALPSDSKLDEAITGADIILEIGPDNLLRALIKDKISGYYDTKRDCNHLLENVKYLKFFNKDYLILRFLGMIVSSRNFNDNEEATDKVIKVYEKAKEIAEKVRLGGLGNTPMPEIPGMPQKLGHDVTKSRISSEDDYFAALAYMRTAFELKKLSESEILYRIKILEGEALIPIQKDYDNVIVTIF